MDILCTVVSILLLSIVAKMFYCNDDGIAESDISKSDISM